MKLTSPDLPLSPMIISDWFPKLGEKAFLAWLNFLNWKEPSESLSSPAVLPYSLCQMIKRLKVGNSTFYNHILRPLWNYGLIDLERTPGLNHYKITVYLYPHNQPENAAKPLNPSRNYDQHLKMTSEINLGLLPSDVVLPTPPNSVPLRPASESADSPSFVPTPYVFPNHRNPTAESPTCTLLPQSIQDAIDHDPLLQEQANGIVQIYHRCKKHPRFTEEGFLQKVHTCLRYAPDPNRFSGYLYKALMNEWNRPSPKQCPINQEHPQKERPRDVPEWVWRQQYGPVEEPEEISEEQKAIIDDLLRQLGEIP